MTKISLAVITGNEEPHVIRFLKSFGGAFDELCMVRAVANLKHDRTVSLAKEWCEKNGKAFKFAEYRNRGWQEGLPENLDVNPHLPETWKHIDDFAAARNLSWSLATGDWVLWADLDDVLAPGSAEKIRDCSGGIDQYSMFYFTYSIRTSLETNLRERMFKRGISRWSQPIHENCRVIAGEETVKACYEPKVVYSHEPDMAKHRDPARNRRILEYHMRFINAFPFELHREYFYLWQADKKEEYAEKSTKWAEIAQVTDILPEQRMQMLLNQASIASETDPQHAIELCWTALRIMPWSRDPWGWMAEYELKKGNGKRAVFLCEMMGKLKRTQDTGMPKSDMFHSWRGLDLYIRALRNCGKHDRADAESLKFFKENKARFSLLHATRGRPEQALRTRSYFLTAAVNPLGVEHIFAIDEDDAESLEALKDFKHVVVKNPNGCVKAWNTAAEVCNGNVLVQLSDDWLPCWEWDEKCWSYLEAGAKEKGGTEVGETPLVLAINDGHRKDSLLCMAICTRERYKQQGHLFAPEYFGVYSDNEFSYRAYQDGIVVDGRKAIMFVHNHPVFEGKPFEQWDETHRRQNAKERYDEGRRVFLERNPEAQAWS